MEVLTSTAHALVAIASTPRTAALLALLVAAAAWDVKTSRIPNKLTVTGMLAGLAFGGFAPEGVAAGLLDAFAGLCTGLACLLPLHALRLMGAGDVKLMAAVGAFLGWPDVLPAVLFTMATGGVLALGWALARRAAGRFAGNVGLILRSWAIAAWTATPAPVPPMQSAGRLPYAVCILVGTGILLVAQRSGT